MDQLRVGSPSIFADHRYCLELSTSSIASFELGSIVLRSLSNFVVPSGSRVVDLRLIPGFPRFSLVCATSLEFPRFSLVFATSMDFPRFLSTYVASLEFPRFFGLRHVSGIPVRSGFPALSVDLRRVAGIPALSSIVGPTQDSRAFVDLRDQASISRVYDLPRLSRWSYIIELFCVTRLNLSGFKLISSLVLKK